MNKEFRWLMLISGLIAVFFLTPAIFAQGVQQGVENLASKLIQNAPQGKRMTVVVSDFPNLQGEVCELGRYISARLTTRLSQTPGIQVRERNRLNQVLDELQFNMEGLVDPGKAKQVGKLLGADALVLGEISDLGTTVEVDARVVELETGNTLPGAFAAVSKDSVVEQLLQKGCARPRESSASRELAATPRQPGSQVPISQARPPDRSDDSIFQNSFLRAKVTTFAPVQDQQTLMAAISIENTLNEDIQLLLLRGSDGRVARTVSDKGASCTPSDVSGLNVVYGTEDEPTIKRALSTLSPRSRIFVAYKMSCDQKTAGDEYSFVSQLMAVVKGQRITFAIGFSDVRPSK